MPTFLGYASSSGSGGITVNNDPLIGLETDYDEVYLVMADNESQTERDIVLTQGVPLIRAYDPVRQGVCTSLSGEKDPETLLWTVTATFSSNTDQDNSEDALDPPQKTPRWSWNSETIEIVAEKDVVSGDRIENSVSEPLFIKTPVPIAVYTVSRIKSFFDENEILNYVGRVNKTDFFGAPVGTALMHSIKDAPIYIQSREYRQVEYVIKFYLYEWSEKERQEWTNFFSQIKDPDIGDNTSLGVYAYTEGLQFKPLTWSSSLLNHGSRYFITAANNDPNNPDHIKRFVDKTGQPTTGNLAKDGTKLAAGEEPHYLLFRHHARADFNTLNLGPF